MSILSRLKQELIVDEGIRLTVYRCPTGYISAGVGRNLETKGLSPAEAYFMLDNDIEEVLEDLQDNIFCGQWRHFPENVQLVLANMQFNLGPLGFRKFKKLIDACKRRNWPDMRKEMMASKWYGQVWHRGVRLVEMIDEVIA